jgi:hypothetical protein
MSKVRVDYEDVIIKTFTVNEEISEKYTFNFDSKWVANDSPTKRIAIRKIEIFPMTFTSITKFTFTDPSDINNRIIDVILFMLTGKKTITEFIDYIVRAMNNRLQKYYYEYGWVITYTYFGSLLTFITNAPNNTINP